MPSPAMANRRPCCSVPRPGLFLVRKHVSQHLLDAHPARNSLRSAAVVAGHHHDMDAAATKLGDSLDGAVLDRVGNHHQAGQSAIDRNEHHAFALRTMLVSRGFQLTGINAKVSKQALVAQRDRPAIDAASDAFAGVGSEIGACGDLDLAVLTPCTIASASGLASAFQAAAVAAFPFLEAGSRYTATSLGLPMVSVPVFRTPACRFLHKLECFSVLTTRRGRPPCRCDHDRHRRGQASGRDKR